MKWYFLLSLCFGFALPALGGGNDRGLQLPHASSATVTRGKDQAVVQYPFGRVELPLEAVKDGAELPPPTGALHARTHGRFTLSYELARDGSAIVAKKIRVHIKNWEEYRSPPTAKLREHEAMHRRINTTEAQRMEKSLSAFRAEKVSPREAERRLKTRFQKEMAAVKRLHQEWDENHVFISTRPF